MSAITTYLNNYFREVQKIIIFVFTYAHWRASGLPIEPHWERDIELDQAEDCNSCPCNRSHSTSHQLES